MRKYWYGWMLECDEPAIKVDVRVIRVDVRV